MRRGERRVERESRTKLCCPPEAGAALVVVVWYEWGVGRSGTGN